MENVSKYIEGDIVYFGTRKVVVQKVYLTLDGQLTYKVVPFSNGFFVSEGDLKSARS